METTYPYGKDIIKWVSTDWLTDNMNSKEIKIVDVQPDVHDYFKEHLPGATYLSEKLFRVPDQGLPAQYIPADALQQIVRRAGIHNEQLTLVYTGKGGFSGCGDGLEQTMAAYTLARFGHSSIYVLDGGIDKWKSENKPLDQDFPSYQDSDFRVSIREDYTVSFEQVNKMKDRDDVVLLDNRPAGVYKGKGPWKKQGHIPGAVNLPWKNLMHPDNPRLLKSEDEIRSIAETAGAVPEKTVICSCGTGREATAAYLAFKWLLGYPEVKVYEGSFTEWVARDQDTVRGAEPY